MILANIPYPDWFPILFFVLLLAGSFYVGAWLQKGEKK
jgi:hypothetical protein